MLRFFITAARCLLIFFAAGCGKKETPEYRLTAEQLAWQPYRVGDVLRFGQARSGKVRTFTIGDIDDRMQSLCNSCGGGINLFPGGSSKLQQIRVDIRRTDTVRYVRSASSTPSKPDSIPLLYADTFLEMRVDNNYRSGLAVVQAQLSWDFGFHNYLPIQEVVANQALPDTAARVLPFFRVGGISYGPVIQLSNSLFASAPLPRTKPIRRLYYARGMGVVAFLEGGTLWYRLP